MRKEFLIKKEGGELGEHQERAMEEEIEEMEQNDQENDGEWDEKSIEIEMIRQKILETRN